MLQRPTITDARRAQQLHHARRGARQIPRLPLHKAANVLRVECVHVLLRGDGLEHAALADPLRQRQLHEDAVDVRAAVQLSDQREQLALRRLRGQAEVHAADAALLTVARLAAHIDLRGGILTHEHDGKAGRARKALHLGADGGLFLRGQRLSVHQLCAHLSSSGDSGVSGTSGSAAGCAAVSASASRAALRAAT